jgi:hypothetical protein
MFVSDLKQIYWYSCSTDGYDKTKILLQAALNILSLKGELSLSIYHVLFMYSMVWGWEVVVCFVDIGGIADHHCLNFLFILPYGQTDRVIIIGPELNGVEINNSSTFNGLLKLIYPGLL